MKKQLKKFFWISVFVCLLCSVVYALFDGDKEREADIAQELNTEMDSNDISIQPTATVLIPPIESLETIPIETQESYIYIDPNRDKGWIPGIEPGVAVNIFESIGFDCEGPSVWEVWSIWDCIYETTEYGYFASIWSPNLLFLDLIEVTAQYYGDPTDEFRTLTSMIFHEISGIQYEGAEPTISSVWVQENLEQFVGDAVIGGIDTSIGGVHFELSGVPASIIFEIGQDTP